ncbi:hypothetical protein [Frigoriflavimonas asaccharolytica]|uniref:Uncharacterized protein n=1 Tax=Frigoriflavimonas asaccharolytica TaxID=2735899 RepID=A0A8J8K9F5_9FLAO|nr:hypothetical protein [Frigoriflavimonas asaccharolytica]NRS93571.1 hypothetical protein [Frigoriflavimonas asaccharolytica]
MMENQKETRLRFLEHAGTVEICSIWKGPNLGYDYFLEIKDIELDKEDNFQKTPIMHEAFYDAFDELHAKYPWHYFQLDLLDEDFSEYVAEKLLEKLNDPEEEWQDYQLESFEKILGLKLVQSEFATKTGFSEITVKTLAKDTEYFYQEFVESYAKEIGQKFKLESTVETWSTFRGESFTFTGTLEISSNAIILKNEDAEICHVLPVDKFQIAAKPATALIEKWHFSIPKNK